MSVHVTPFNSHLSSSSRVNYFYFHRQVSVRVGSRYCACVVTRVIALAGSRMAGPTRYRMMQ
jgi:hypothetical protein